LKDVSRLPRESGERHEASRGDECDDCRGRNGTRRVANELQREHHQKRRFDCGNDEPHGGLVAAGFSLHFEHVDCRVRHQDRGDEQHYRKAAHAARSY